MQGHPTQLDRLLSSSLQGRIMSQRGSMAGSSRMQLHNTRQRSTMRRRIMQQKSQCTMRRGSSTIAASIRHTSQRAADKQSLTSTMILSSSQAVPEAWLLPVLLDPEAQPGLLPGHAGQ